MATIDRVGGFLVRIYSNDHQPAHVHVVKGGALAIIEIAREAGVPEAYGMSPADLRRAIARGKELSSTQPRAARAMYEAEGRRIIIELRNGCVFGFPPELSEGLAGASEEQLAEVEVEGDGYGLHWESLDVDLTVPGILNGIFGSHAWMAELGRRGGSATSEVKRRASRANGSKGGRPRKRAG